MKNVLLLVHDDEGQEARLQAALDVTRSLSGHLTCLDVIVSPIVVSDFYTSVTEAAMLDEARQREAENVAKLRARLEKEDVAWTILEAYGDPAAELQAAAGFADLIVVSSRSENYDPAARRIVGDLVVKSGRPVLAVPPHSRGLNLAGKALVAWDGSNEANEALRAAIPLLRLAGDVAMVEITHGGGDFDGLDAATFLSRHDIHPAFIRRATDEPIVDAILDEARGSDAAYIVMGAYGQPRAIENIFGGVTVKMVESSELPLFLHR